MFGLLSQVRMNDLLNIKSLSIYLGWSNKLIVIKMLLRIIINIVVLKEIINKIYQKYILYWIIVIGI